MGSFLFQMLLDCFNLISCSKCLFINSISSFLSIFIIDF
ncbi:hypothetical protein CHCC15087_4750 [Bacillus licheniformis]|nr:hypothetical protein CHCC15087_4750 [Bacillus licheniformis]